MAPQTLNMTNIWDDNYMILNSQYEKGMVNDDLANAIQEYVASTINKSNIGGENFFVSGDTSNSVLRENFQDSLQEKNDVKKEVNSISEYVSKKCQNFLPEGETEDTYKFNSDPETIGGDPYSLCKLSTIIEQNKKESMSDYQKKKVAEQKEKLKKKSRNSTKQVKMAIDQFNLRETSLPELYSNIMNTLYNIIEDLTNFDATGTDLNQNVQKLIKIFFGNNRIMYVGIIVVVISFIIYLLDTSS